jgi:hypothetical protein
MSAAFNYAAVITAHTAAKWKEETLRRIKKKVTEVPTWLNKGPQMYCESVFGVGCKHMC